MLASLPNLHSVKQSLLNTRVCVSPVQAAHDSILQPSQRTEFAQRLLVTRVVPCASAGIVTGHGGLVFSLDMVTPGSMPRYFDKSMKVVESGRARVNIFFLINENSFKSLFSYGRKDGQREPQTYISTAHNLKV